MVSNSNNVSEQQSPNRKKDRQQSVEIASRWIESKPVFLDTETTGLDEDAEAIEVGIVNYNGNVLFDELIKPVGSISDDAQKVHGITEKQLEDAPGWPDVHNEICSILEHRPVVIYNFPFDTRIVDQTISRHKFLENTIDWPKKRCAMRLYARYNGIWNDKYGNYSWETLSHAAKNFDISFNNKHRATSDAEATRKVIKCMSENYDGPNTRS